MTPKRSAKLSVYVGRVLMTAALAALLCAWLSQVGGGTLLGMSQQHLFSDAAVLALLGIGSYLDALWHASDA